jgi:AraC-like DNA-binding protein
MQYTNLHNVSISQFRKFFSDAGSVGMGDDFCIIDVNIKDNNRVLAHPFRIDGYMVLYCINGHIKLNVNLQEHELKSGMLFLNYPGSIIRVNDILDVDEDGLKYICVVMSREFVGNLMLDVNKLFTQNLSLLGTPSLSLTDAQTRLLREHVSLMVNIVNSESSFKLESIRSILSSVFYFIAGFWAEKAANKNHQPASGRNRMVFDQFIKLVSEYHTSYRNVGFYADKLSLTPKYLSRIIRDASGRSAPEWIDEYVILEAKNLLKYSGLPIKEIVYKLNFPSQSVFYKFFKARTGMTPTEYKNF